MGLLAVVVEKIVAANGTENDEAALEKFGVYGGDAVTEAVLGELLGVAAVIFQGPKRIDGFVDILDALTLSAFCTRRAIDFITSLLLSGWERCFWLHTIRTLPERILFFKISAIRIFSSPLISLETEKFHKPVILVFLLLMFCPPGPEALALSNLTSFFMIAGKSLGSGMVLIIAPVKRMRGMEIRILGH